MRFESNGIFFPCIQLPLDVVIGAAVTSWRIAAQAQPGK
jgi:hypothetical protein